MYGITYRPHDFESVIGAEAQKRVLVSTLRMGEYDNGYLFAGPWGVGKTTLARIFARAILCPNKKDDMSPCNECESCRTFLEDRNPSFLEIDAASNGNKEDIEHLLSSLSFENMAGRKIILIDESHNISPAGKDALLKVLEKEEGSNSVIFMLCTTEYGKMPESLLSRCMQFRLVSPSKKQIFDKLKKICDSEGIEFEEEALDTVADFADGHFRDAENALRNVSRLGRVDTSNVGDVLSIYTREVADLLIGLRHNLKEALVIGDELCAKSSIENIYRSVLKLLVDSMRLRMGTSSALTDYDKMLSDISDAYDNSLVGVLDYILNKDKMKNRTVFQSDLILIHYKFLRGDFSSSADAKITRNSLSSSKIKSKDDGSTGLESLSSWERIERARKIKAEKRGASRDRSVDERISHEWGSPKSSNSDSAPKLSREIDTRKFGDVARSSKKEKV